jgi:2-polyprenyl-3-methyl-5-hydroxy-6-metoxy-1,4-benzoquinol methylase
MNNKFIELLRCPVSGQMLRLKDKISEITGESLRVLISEDGKNEYPVKNNIPRFVPKDNYSDSFGMQWNIFSKTQLDGYSGIRASNDRFWSATNWTKEELSGQWVLDIGCGAGRFAEIALRAGANVIAIDYSHSVDACYENLKHFDNLYVVQADIYELPFETDSFSYIYSLGVLQHTPDVEAAFFSLPKLLKNNGKIAVDYYCKSWKSFFLPKYWLRHFTKYLPKPLVLNILKYLIPIVYPIGWLIGKLPYGYLFKRAIPVADPIYYYEREYGKTDISYKKRLEWSLLDTFDWLTPAYDNPQTEFTINEWMERANLKNIEVLKAGHMVARGNK